MHGQDLDKNTQTDVLYLDFAKAFDSVDHNILSRFSTSSVPYRTETYQKRF
jgi:hypothetical protein